jgi:hypothetical protein
MEETWTVRDVYLLAAGSDGQVAVPELTLIFLPDGMELDKPDGEPVWRRRWSRLRQLATVERSTLPDGSAGVVVEVVERGRRGRRHRFVVPATDPSSFEELVTARARAHGLQTTVEGSPVSRAVTAVIVVAAIVTMTVLLLSAAHVVRL